MRHRMKGRKLGRNGSHRKAMFRNMACSLIKSVRIDEDAEGQPKVPGRIITTWAKAKELRPFVEKLITIARKASAYQEAADAHCDGRRTQLGRVADVARLGEVERVEPGNRSGRGHAPPRVCGAAGSMRPSTFCSMNWPSGSPTVPADTRASSVWRRFAWAMPASRR